MKHLQGYVRSSLLRVSRQRETHENRISKSLLHGPPASARDACKTQILNSRLSSSGGRAHSYASYQKSSIENPFHLAQEKIHTPDGDFLENFPRYVCGT